MKHEIALKSSKISVYLDLIRVVAAFLVVMGHWRGLFFVNYESLSLDVKNVIVAFIYFITGFGHQSVIMFFVLSGFLVGSSVIKLVESNRWSWKLYFTNRLTRLYIVLIPALVLGLLWDISGVFLFGINGLYGGNSINSAVVNYPIVSRIALSNFLGNLFFLQEIIVKPFGSNGALWSLSYEFWYYIIFPFCLISLNKISNTEYKKGVFYIAVSVLLLTVVGQKIREYFLIWLIGVVLAKFMPPQWDRSLFRIRVFNFLSLSALLIYLTLIRIQALHFDSEYVSDLILSILFSAFIYSILFNYEKSKNRGRQLPTYLAGFSYTLYLIHLPILVFFRELLLSGKELQPRISSFVIALPVLIVTLFYAFIVGSLTEAKTEEVRKLIKLNLKSLNVSLPIIKLKKIISR